ncbi:MAG: hypothetical protein LBC72_04730 [Spirochaetaceae bacterium]|jgi:hypothetical protein|nr:hypothetical protein [Spirochaetaceae bacterium]
MPRKKKKRLQLVSPATLCVVYPLAAALLIILFYCVAGGIAYDDGVEYLPIYRLPRALTNALITWISLFPALILSAIVLPFGLKPDYAPPERRFSLKFFNKLKPALISATAAAAFIALLTLMARPALYNRLSDMRTNSNVYRQSKKQAEIYADREDWALAAGFLSICVTIWPHKNPEIEPLADRIRVGQEHLLYGRPQTTRARPVLEQGLPGQKQPVSATEALSLANKAMDEGRLYDAHWLASLAVRISPEGSAENSAGRQLASWAWSQISVQEPDAAEMRLAAIYRQKRAGYEAILAEDWIRAYYIFHELSLIVSDDPDVGTYLKVSAEGLSQLAFFIDEMNTIAGEELENVVLSIPRQAEGGRVVLRLGYFSALTESPSYASRLEALAVDAAGRLAFRVETPFAKIMPVYTNGAWRTAVLLRAVDRENEAVSWSPLWEAADGKSGDYQIVLDMSYEDFLLATTSATYTDSFFLADLWRAARGLSRYGYAPEVFQAEILRVISEPLLFLPLAMFAIACGWLFRARSRPRFAGFPMIVLLPLVFNALFTLALGNIQNLYVMLILGAGFTGAAVAAGLLVIVLFALSLLSIAAQHS